ncbi:alanine aminotransferase 2 [Phytophthora infestans T30-4]|uniref:Alanine aminotransferase 2 n=2 Tax=Phytophthora infestans TaxID=4787 RepID=D0MY09_PHYIT|nr:alanine aminotransferase 2 [Phytophthora infestans T30-4]EEY66057.1 alanine aminotransferase 2 [Phytophthora infestans T30-4]KAF4043829.1 Aminotransferase class I and II [Phytophthora infestans]KAF4136932.1 Aminotransferase class I and II [Phytophthora infestans]|eukprot:XP_002906656.1 alanine aminotransferase 2 [Phytophthora infestans T30-4]
MLARHALKQLRASSSQATRGFAVLTADTINPNIVKAEYAVRGALVLRSNEYENRLANGDKSLPFDKVIPCNIGNPQVLKQEPIEFQRQVLALVNVPGLVDQPEAQKLFPPDAIARAKFYIDNIVGGTGAYGHSKGSAVVREEVARFMQRRDGHPADPEDIYLTDGASPAVQNSLLSLIRDENDAIMAPIPQYPLYSAAIAINGGTLVGYYLDEANAWGLDVDELARAVKEARDAGKSVRAMAVINPGNPTGQCLSEKNIEEIIKFCKKEDILILADEVYQENVYAEGKKFFSFKKVLRDMGKEYDDVELISFHSTSKGFTGECGRRGGYMELVNIDEGAKDQFYKLMSVNLCSNIEGQLVVGMMTNPPQPGDASYERYAEQRDGTLGSLKRRAEKLVKAFNELEGVTCNETEGAMYTFPNLTLPPKAVEAAKEAGMAPDAFYCTQMLDDTGIVVVPGSGFGQKEGTWHFRTTILPPEDAVDDVIEMTSKFHAKFMDTYR